MKRILFVGESPLGCTGNSNFMRVMLAQLNKEKYKAACFAVGTSSLMKLDIFSKSEVPIIPADGSQDKWNGKKLLHLVKENPVDAIVFVGIDCWVYAPIYEELNKLRDMRRFRTIGIFPYDAQEVRKDWVHWLNMFELPCVYSEYGYNKIKEHVPNLRYFRPYLFAHKLFRKLSDEKRSVARHKYFPTVGEGFLFSFLGNNQVRKDPQTAITAFSMVKRKHPEAYLYMHCNMNTGVYNLVQHALDCGLKSGDLIAKSGDPDAWLALGNWVELYGCFDALVNCSYQEGLSWTLLEAMLCKVPIVATDTTAQTELVKDAGLLVPCEEKAYLPVFAERGQSWIDAKSCKAEDLAEAMEQIMTDSKLRESCIARGFNKAEDWMKGCHDITKLVDEVFQVTDVISAPSVAPTIKDEVCFAQHSSAGDVLMTTKCFKGLRERYDGRPLVYMTQRQYVDIVEGNPYLKKVIVWDEAEFNSYRFRLNPHQERILPGHWGRNCNTILSDFYWKILMVKPDSIFIDKVEPEEHIRDLILSVITNGKKLCIVHTTGGDPSFRTYQYMNHVCQDLRDDFYTIQVGSSTDYEAAADLDLRGKLSFRQTAWVMQQSVLSINVDSFVSHLAGATGVSQIVLFGSGNAFVVRPDQTKGELICMVPDYIMDCPGLGPCSGSIRNCPAPCTGVHNPKEIVSQVRQLQDRGQIKRSEEHETASYSFQYVSRDQSA